MLRPLSMEACADSGTVAKAHNLSDLTVFNRWLCVSRLRATGAVVLFVALLEILRIGNIAAVPVLAICIGLAAFSTVVLRSKTLEQAPVVLFHSQCLVDLVGVTVGIAASMSGTTALLFHLIYVLVIVPPSLISAPAGLLVAVGASLGHETLLVLDRGLSLGTMASLESLAPVFLFFLVAQQCFFYARHLQEKNAALARLASHLQRSRERLAGLVDVARMLNSTVDAPELWARVNQAALRELGGDWAAMCLVDSSRETFRAAAVSDSPRSSDALGCAELPMQRWPALARLRDQRVITLTGLALQDVPELLTGDRALHTLLLAGLYRDGDLVGFLALGYESGIDAAPGGTLDQLNGIVEHATIALRNAQLLDEARQASVMKSEFVSTISHELRTPLNVIIGYTEMLRDGAVGMLTTPQHEIFERIDTEARGLFELIEATLQVGRIETRGATVTLARVPLPELVAALHAAMTTLPRPTTVTFEWRAMPDSSGTMVTDAAKVVLIVRNLVSNAFKFTSEGRVAVRLSTHGTQLILSVADTGIGIAPGNLPIIFDMFRQLDSGTARRGGVGLGLYIVKQMVQRLDGTIVVDSELGKGSEFRVAIPGYEADEQGIARGAA
jgi:signal transduction histidine kinase